jgi:PleD family two-component response regulator
VAYAAPGAAKSAQALIAAADKGLYQAKQAGGNQFVMIHMDPVLVGG